MVPGTQGAPGIEDLWMPSNAAEGQEPVFTFEGAITERNLLAETWYRIEPGSAEDRHFSKQIDKLLGQLKATPVVISKYPAAAEIAGWKPLRMWFRYPQLRPMDRVATLRNGEWQVCVANWVPLEEAYPDSNIRIVATDNKADLIKEVDKAHSTMYAAILIEMEPPVPCICTKEHFVTARGDSVLTYNRHFLRINREKSQKLGITVFHTCQDWASDATQIRLCPCPPDVADGLTPLWPTDGGVLFENGRPKWLVPEQKHIGVSIQPYFYEKAGQVVSTLGNGQSTEHLARSLFTEGKWPKPRQTAADNNSVISSDLNTVPDPDNPNEELVIAEPYKFFYDETTGMSYVRKMLPTKNDDEEKLSKPAVICNFEWLGLHMYANSNDGDALLVFKCRLANNKPEAFLDTIHVCGQYVLEEGSFERQMSYPEQEQYKEIVVYLPINASDITDSTKTGTIISREHALLRTYPSNFTKLVWDHLKDTLMIQNRNAPNYTWVTSFGLQNDGVTWAFFNCAVRNGEILSHEQANIFVSPIAMMQDKGAPMEEKHLPRLLKVDNVGDRLKHLITCIEIICRYQKKNKFATLLLLGVCIGNMHFLDIKDWLHGFPISVVMASQGGIGKTEAVLFLLRLFGITAGVNRLNFGGLSHICVSWQASARTLRRAAGST